MSESFFPRFRTISFTPMRDLLRLRLTGRLDWKAQVGAAELPVPIMQLILRVVESTRLWRLEKAAVAGELAAHFLDGLDAGMQPALLIAAFGDERVAAQLIRRAKRRGRPIVWHIWNWCIRGMAVLIGIYSIFLVRFFVQGPSVNLDYVAGMNAWVNGTADADRAWPIWRKAILASSDGVKEGWLHFPDASPLGNTSSELSTPAERAAWIMQHQSVIEAARQAGQKPELGFILGASGSVRDSAVFPLLAGKGAESEPQSIISVELPHLNLLRGIAEALSLDVKLCAERGKGRLVEADLMAIHGLSQQLHSGRAPLVSQLIGMNLGQTMIDRLEWVLENHPAVLSDEQLIEMAHLIAGPRVAADLIDLDTERASFADALQRTYTDDGHGDGHVTMQGLKALQQMMVSPHIPNFGPEEATFAAVATVPLVVASRAEVMAVYNKTMDAYQANFAKPIREVNPDAPFAQFLERVQSTTDRIHFAMLAVMMPSLGRLEGSCEIYLGSQDAAEAAIALELFHRQHGAYPTSMGELTAEYLPSVPVDRITGETVKYRLADGKPIIYSVGADRVDDGGKWPKGEREKPAQWGIKLSDAPRGDWVLYPPRGMDSD